MSGVRILSKVFFLGLSSIAFATSASAGGLSLGHESTLKIEVSAEQDRVTGAEAFVGSMAQRAIGFLGDEKITQEERTKKFKDLLNDSFDMNALARFSLGRYWRTATKKQQDEYMALFKKMIVEVYSNRFNEYKGQDLEVRSSRAEGESDVFVTSFMVAPGDPEIRIDWRVRYKNGRYKVIDVIVEGVSMAVTQRSDFAAVIQNGGGNVDVLLAQLR